MDHHPEAAWLEQYAAGALPVSVSLCVSTHLSFCSACRRRVGLLQSLGGLLIEQLEPMPVPEQLLTHVLAQIDADLQPAPAMSSNCDDTDGIPKPLRKLIAEDYRHLSWSRILPDLQAVKLAVEDSDYRVALHRIKAGGKVARHDHRGEEFTVVLRGSFSDEYGVYGDGDFILRESGEVHSPLAALNDACICLTAQRARVRFTGFFWRCLNPLLN